MRFFIVIFLCVLLNPLIAFSKEEWKEQKGLHFIIYYKDAPEDFVKSVEESAERYYDEIKDSLGFTRYKSWTSDQRAQIYIYNDSEDYVQGARQASWSHGAASAKDKVIHTFPSAHGFFDSTLPHELGHIIFREFIGFNARVPLWFEEGIAMYQEKAKRWGANALVKQAIEERRFIPIDELGRMSFTSTTDKALVELFYTEAASIVYFLIKEYGEYRFANLCRKLQEGILFEQAFPAVYVNFRDLKQLNKAWLNYIEE